VRLRAQGMLLQHSQRVSARKGPHNKLKTCKKHKTCRKTAQAPRHRRTEGQEAQNRAALYHSGEICLAAAPPSGDPALPPNPHRRAQFRGIASRTSKKSRGHPHAPPAPARARRASRCPQPASDWPPVLAPLPPARRSPGARVSPAFGGLAMPQQYCQKRVDSPWIRPGTCSYRRQAGRRWERGECAACLGRGEGVSISYPLGSVIGTGYPEADIAALFATTLLGLHSVQGNPG
jgi:hypothetical protein